MEMGGSRSLPAAIAGYRPRLERVLAGRHAVDLLRPPSAEDLIDEREYERDERLPYWAELWPSARVLADRLALRPLERVRVLELGCGLGLPAVVAALQGARVLATDWYRPALAFVEHHAALAGVTVETMVVDWRAPPGDLIALAPFDLVIGADLLYEERNGAALADLLDAVSGPATEVLITDPRRPHAGALLDPLRAAGRRISTEDVAYTGPRDESGAVVHLHRIAPPAKEGPPG
jgi:predicted nicotinamide N-methyase